MVLIASPCLIDFIGVELKKRGEQGYCLVLFFLLGAKHEKLNYSTNNFSRDRWSTIKLNLRVM